MTDLTPLRELLTKWDNRSKAAWGKEEIGLRNGYDACHADLEEALAAIEAANPWIPIEKGLPDEPPSWDEEDVTDTLLWDVWCAPNDDEFPAELVKRQYWRVFFARGGFRTGHCDRVRIRYVTHYRRHVPEKGPSE